MEVQDKLTESVMSVSSATMVSRILGYLRDMVIANVFGAGLAADAYFVAYRIPNLLRRLLGEGALSASLIPVFSEYRERRGEEEARVFIQGISRVLSVLLVFITVGGIITAPLIVRLIAPGFISDTEKFRLTVTLTRIMFPFLLAISFAALSMGILNTLHYFFIPALAPCFLSISEILFVLFICPLLETPIKGLAAGVLMGGFAQFAFQLPAIYKNGYGLSFWRKLREAISHPGVKRVGLLMLPAAWGLSVVQINVFVDTILATLLEEGSVTALYYATRLYHLPLALFGTAVSTVTLPLFSHARAIRKERRWKEIFSLGNRMVLFTLLPSAMGFMIIGKPIIALLFERGAFDSVATVRTSWALLFYALGLVAFGAMRILVAGFYSLEDTRTPVKVATAACLLNIVLNLALMGPLKVGGLALATSLAGGFNVIALFIILRKKLGPLGGKEILISLMKFLLATILTGVMVWFIMFRVLVGMPLLFRVFIVILLACGIYVLLTLILGCREVYYFKEFVLRRNTSQDEV